MSSWPKLLPLFFLFNSIRSKLVPKLKCGVPPSIPNAYHDSSGAEYSFDTVIHYSCNNGYYRADSGLPLAKCLSNNGVAKWYGPSVQCAAIQCPEPSDPRHGGVQGQRLDYLARITYVCDDGFRLVGQTPRICQADKTWSGHDPICEEIRCPTLGPLDHGHMRGEDTTYKAIVMFYCEQGAVLSGSQYARCQKDGIWSNPPPKCLAACQMPKVKYGEIRKIHGSDKVRHDQQIEIKCDDKYELESLDLPRCVNGLWSYFPNCVPIRCKTSPPSIRNGHVVFINTDHGANAKYICKSGFIIKNGEDKITCRFGLWEGSIPECEEIFCDQPNDLRINLNNGTIKLEGSMGTYEYKKYIHGTGEYRNIIFECQKGFVLTGPRRVACVNGTWEPLNIKRECVEQTNNTFEDIEWKISSNLSSSLRGANDTSSRDTYARSKRLSRLAGMSKLIWRQL